MTSGACRVKKFDKVVCESEFMTTLLVNQPQGMDHVTPPNHAECPERLTAIANALSADRFDTLERRDAQSIDLAIAELVHAPGYLEMLRQARPMEGIGKLDTDTFMSRDSFEAASSAVGAGLMALEAVVLGEVDNAFCAIRPPGHHAEIDRPMGFCLVNNIAIVAREAQRKYGAERIAIVDFDVHHGNGTQDIFKQDASVFYASTHQMPLFPGTGSRKETGVGNIVNVPLPTESGTREMREAYNELIFPALRNFSPDLLLLSAGFDADKRDPLAQLEWVPDDFSWVTGKLMDIADRKCEGRIVSMLEGGYDMDGLAEGVAAHVTMLQSGTAG